MTATPILDVEQILAPISEEQPTGAELLLSDEQGSILKIKDAFDQARKLVKEKQDRIISGGIDKFGNPWRIVPDPDWSVVISLGESILRTESKDFRVASWLTEALLREHYLPGLRDGLKICFGLCERYWDNVRPSANDEDGHGVTVAPFSSLVATPEQAKRIDVDYSAVLSAPIFAGSKPGERTTVRFSTLDYLRAKELDSLTDDNERSRRIELGHVSVVEYKAVASSTAPDFLQSNLEAVQECLELCQKLGDFFRENCRPDRYGEDTAPAIYGFREQLDTVRRLLLDFSGEPSEVSTDAGTAEVASGGGGAPASGRSQELTRESALQQVETVAQFFERTEPHSPVYFALRQVIRWGRMPFPELLAELINDESVMYQLRKQIGLPERVE